MHNHDSPVPLSDLCDVPCLILLGSPGLGKSTEIRLAANDAKLRGEAADVIPLGRLSGPQELSSRILEGARDKSVAQGVWTIFLDGLDEALPQFAKDHHAIATAFRTLSEARDLSTVKLRITCRTAELPKSIETDLADLWGPKSVQVYELQELDDSDVEEAASQFLPMQAKDFLAQIRQTEVDALTKRPVTLNMLLDVFGRASKLPKQRAQLYREALLASISDRAPANRDLGLNEQTKLIIAARIATASVFSNLSEISATTLTGRRTLSIPEIAGGFEPTPEGSIAVGDAELNEALLTSLFAVAGDSIFVWSHQTFAEFLAAYYLIQHRLSPSKMIDFLRSSPGSRVAPQLREVAAWLASMDGAFFAQLIEEEPDILLRSDIASASPQDREALVRELLVRYERAELHDFDYDSKSRYDQLGHPHLGDQLKPFIEAKDKNIVVRRVAIDIAEASNGAGLDELLVEVALDTSEPYHIRTQAAAAVSKLSNVEARLRLRRLLEPHSSDENDELKGYALRSLWPTYLTVEELLRSITPEKNTSWIGSYASFLSHVEIPTLAEHEIPSALDWIASTLKQDQHRRAFDRVIARILDRVWERAYDPQAIRHLATFILELVASAHYYLLEDSTPSFFTGIRQRTDLRIRLVREIVHQTRDKNWNWLASRFTARLIEDSDLPWLLAEARSPSDSFPAEASVELIVSLTWGRDINELEEVWEVAEESPLLASALQTRFSCDLTSAVSNFEREDYKRRNNKKAREDKERFDAMEAINDRLKKIEAGDFFSWWELNLILLSDERGMFDDFKSDLTQAHVWSALSDSIRDRIVSTSKQYLTQTNPRSSDWLGSNSFSRPAAAAYRAFALLFAADRNAFLSLSPSTWKAWAACIFVSFNTDDEQARRTIVKRAYELAPDMICRCVARLLLKNDSDLTASELTRMLDPCLDERLGLLWWKLFERKRGKKSASSLLFYLASKNDRRARQLIFHEMGRGGSTTSSSQLTTEELVTGISGLLEADTQSAWQKFVSFREHNPDLALNVVRNIAHGAYSDETFITRLGTAELADFFVWTFGQIPPSPEARRGGFRWVSPDNQIEHLRNAALKRLVSLGTSDALSAVQHIATELPSVPWLKYQVLDAQRAVDANTWKSRAPSELIATIALWSPPSSPRSTKAAAAAAAGIAETGALLASSLLEDITPEETIDLPSDPPSMNCRRILLVATEWRSGHGGISTLNRELGLALADLGHQIACLVLNADESEISEAASANVRLITPPSAPGTSPDDIANLLRFYPAQLSAFQPDAVVGHDHITGLAAHHIARHIYAVPYVHFVHTLPEEIEKYKSRGPASKLRGGIKSGIQTDQCRLAQLVVAVGPRIHADFQSRLGWAGVKVIEIAPGLNRKLTKYTADITKPRRSDCLLVARLEDPILKGAPLACRVIKELNTKWTWKPASKRPKLILRGFTEDKFESEVAAIDGIDGAHEYVSYRPYTADEDHIAGDICSASVVIMPSKMEGFGLTALEAIAAGIPTIMTSESGLGELLIRQKIAAINSFVENGIADVIGDANAVAKDWADRIADMLLNIDKAFENAAKLRSALMPILTWERAARTLSMEIEALLSEQS